MTPIRTHWAATPAASRSSCANSPRISRRATTAECDVALAAARYRLGLQSADSLRALAVALLADGHDEALPLAIADELRLDEAGPVCERLCSDLGHPVPSHEAAFDVVTAALLRDIVEGRSQPEGALAQLMRDVVRPHLLGRERPGFTYAGEQRGLHHLIALHSQYDDVRERPDDFDADAIAQLDRHVVRYAQAWLAAR
jgi:hypothetical protein